MNDYELTIETIMNYKIKACELVGNDCNKCESLHECNGKQWCSFDTVTRFIEYANTHNI
jgi:hypothetical protein